MVARWGWVFPAPLDARQFRVQRKHNNATVNFISKIQSVTNLGMVKVRYGQKAVNEKQTSLKFSSPVTHYTGLKAPRKQTDGESQLYCRLCGNQYTFDGDLRKVGIARKSRRRSPFVQGLIISLVYCGPDSAHWKDTQRQLLSQQSRWRWRGGGGGVHCSRSGD